VPRGEIHRADLITGKCRRRVGQKNPLNIPCDLEITLEQFFLTRLALNRIAVQRKRTLLRDRPKDAQIVF